MMRQYNFRGKRIDNDEWIYGYFAKFGQIATIMCLKDTYWYAVVPEAVGQWTGLKDRNGKEIYEGDILKVCNGSINGIGWFDKPYPVEYVLNKGFNICMFCWDKDGNSEMNSTHWCEVIGNIYENPELLNDARSIQGTTHMHDPNIKTEEQTPEAQSAETVPDAEEGKEG